MHVRDNSEETHNFVGRSVSRLRRQLDRLLNEMGGISDSNTWIPSVEVFALDEEIRVDFELPGVEADDVSIAVMHGTLSVSGARHREWLQDPGLRYHMTERPSSSFFRSITLPEQVDVARITADFRNGVLRVRIPNPVVDSTFKDHSSRGGSSWRPTFNARRHRSG